MLMQSRATQRLDESSTAIRTHLSEVFLSSNRAYKLLRPVETTFVDFRDRATRLEAARREYELNRRLSPDVYLGLADVIENDELVDRLIVMDRLPADRQLDRLLNDPALLDHLREVARLVASFHAGQPPVTGSSASAVAGADALRRNWADHFRVLEPMAGNVIPIEEFRRARRLVERFISGRTALFGERIEQGWIRDGHGDLRCEHVFCLDDGPRLIDCLAFNDEFRIGDVLNDVAFLAMDLHRLAGPGAAMWFVERYDEFCNEHHPSSLAHHYVAYRAYVRAKVAAIRFSQGDEDALAEVEEYHRLALQHLEVGRPRLILVGGGAGVGKSTVAEHLADRLAATWLRADEVRKNLAGASSGEHRFDGFEEGLYDPKFSDRVYRDLLAKAELLLERGESVVLDASWGAETRRNWARHVGRRTSSTVVELLCRAPAGVARQRIVERMATVYNPSDATPEIAERIQESFDPWPAAAIIDTNRSIAQSIDSAYCQVMDSSDRDASTETMRVDGAMLTEETISLFLSRASAGVFVRAGLRSKRTEA